VDIDSPSNEVPGCCWLLAMMTFLAHQHRIMRVAFLIILSCANVALSLEKDSGLNSVGNMLQVLMNKCLCFTIPTVFVKSLRASTMLDTLAFTSVLSSLSRPVTTQLQ
jgi:hypothetical protein